MPLQGGQGFTGLTVDVDSPGSVLLRDEHVRGTELEIGDGLERTALHAVDDSLHHVLEELVALCEGLVDVIGLELLGAPGMEVGDADLVGDALGRAAPSANRPTAR